MTTVTIEHPPGFGELKRFHTLTDDILLALSGEENGQSGILKVTNTSGASHNVLLPSGHWLEENSPHPIEVRDGDRLELSWTVDNDSVDWNYTFFQQI